MCQPKRRRAPEQVGSAELVATLCLATDLGMGFPFEHGLRSTLIASRLAERLGVDAATASHTYYACLLSHAGCTADAHVTPVVFGDSLTTHLHPVMYGSGRQVVGGLLRSLPEPDRSVPVRAFQVARGLPRMAREQRPRPDGVVRGGRDAGHRDRCSAVGAGSSQLSNGALGRLGTASPRERGGNPARDADRARRQRRRLQHLLGGVERAARLVRERAGHASIPRSRPAWRTVPRRSSRSASTSRPGTRHSLASRARRHAHWRGARSRLAAMGNSRT